MDRLQSSKLKSNLSLKSMLYLFSSFEGYMNKPIWESSSMVNGNCWIQACGQESLRRHHMKLLKWNLECNGQESPWFWRSQSHKTPTHNKGYRQRENQSRREMFQEAKLEGNTWSYESEFALMGSVLLTFQSACRINIGNNRSLMNPKSTLQARLSQTRLRHLILHLLCSLAFLYR